MSVMLKIDEAVNATYLVSEKGVQTTRNFQPAKQAGKEVATTKSPSLL